MILYHMMRFYMYHMIQYASYYLTWCCIISYDTILHDLIPYSSMFIHFHIIWYNIISYDALSFVILLHIHLLIFILYNMYTILYTYHIITVLYLMITFEHFEIVHIHSNTIHYCIIWYDTVAIEFKRPFWNRSWTRFLTIWYR